jgi:phage terminase large subunit-like protein
MFWPAGNPFFTGEIFEKFPYLKKGRVVSGHTNIQENLIPEMKFWFPKGKYTTAKKGKQYEAHWETDSGFEFDVMTYDQDLTEFESVTLGWVYFDEPPPEAIFKAIISRMRRGGIIFISATPLEGSAYLYDTVANGAIEIEVTTEEGGQPEKVTRKIGYIEAGIESACKQHGIRGHLEHSDILQMVAEYDEDEKQARIYGKFQHLVGLVFKRWNQKIHVIPGFNVTMRDYTVYEFLDPHPRNPDAVLWVAVDKNGTKFVVDELYAAVNGDEDLATKIKAKASQYRVVARYADPAAFVANQHDAKEGAEPRSLGDRLNDYGLTYLPATKARAESDRRIRQALNYTEVGGMMLKPPELYVFEECKRLRFEMDHYRWGEYSGKSAEKHNRMEKPVDKDDHEIENLGRALIIEPQFIPYNPKNSGAFISGDVMGDDPYDRS